ncbi:MAG: hypothetical protein PVF14_15990, partial [Desulfobacterales bacterium]
MKLFIKTILTSFREEVMNIKNNLIMYCTKKIRGTSLVVIVLLAFSQLIPSASSETTQNLTE